eukprot:6203036-Pleurochrysis_carterae.AAC.1
MADAATVTTAEPDLPPAEAGELWQASTSLLPAATETATPFHVRDGRLGVERGDDDRAQLLAVGPLPPDVGVVVADQPVDARLQKVDRGARVALGDLDGVDGGARRQPVPAAGDGARHVRAVAARVHARAHVARRALDAVKRVVRGADARVAARVEKVAVVGVDPRVDHEDVHALAAKGQVGVGAFGAVVGAPLDDALEVPAPVVVENRHLCRERQEAPLEHVGEVMGRAHGHRRLEERPRDRLRERA